GYIAELNNSELSHLTPPSLENKKDVLFGNLPEIYEFHNKLVKFFIVCLCFAIF
ncbi:Proto-oncoprotein DBL, partial [Goodea atripinnis]